MEVQECYVNKHGKVKDYYIKFEGFDFYRVVSFYFNIDKEVAYKFILYEKPQGEEVKIEEIPESVLELAKDGDEFYARLYKYEIVDYIN